MLSLTKVFDQLQVKDAIIVQGEAYKIANLIMAVEEEKVLKGQMILVPETNPNSCICFEFSSIIYNK